MLLESQRGRSTEHPAELLDRLAACIPGRIGQLDGREELRLGIPNAIYRQHSPDLINFDQVSVTVQLCHAPRAINLRSGSAAS